METDVTLQAMVKHIELWLIDRLIPFARNPRTHSDAQIAQIAASIAEFGVNTLPGGRLLVERGAEYCARTRHPDPYPSGPSTGMGKICKVLVSLVTRQRLPANRAARESHEQP